MTALLTGAELNAAIAGLDGWTGDPTGLRRSVELRDFPTAISVVDSVADVAQRLDHHPDIDIRWRTLTFRCSTHSEGGVTAYDVTLAEEIDGVVDAITQPG